jgi:hypothetical protein
MTEFDPDEQAALDKVSEWLRGQGWGRGWATPLTVQRLLRDWQDLAIEVDRYVSTIDDYTNDLTTRDGLEIALARCDEPLHGKLQRSITAADAEFIARTVDDAEQTLGRYRSITAESG